MINKKFMHLSEIAYIYKEVSKSVNLSMAFGI